MRLLVPVTVWPILSCVLYEITAPGKEDPNGCEAGRRERRKTKTVSKSIQHNDEYKKIAIA